MAAAQPTNVSLIDLSLLPACANTCATRPPLLAGAPEHATVFLADKYIKPWTLLAIAFSPAESRLLNDLGEKLRAALAHVQAKNFFCMFSQ